MKYLEALGSVRVIYKHFLGVKFFSQGPLGEVQSFVLGMFLSDSPLVFPVTALYVLRVSDLLIVTKRVLIKQRKQ